MNSAMKILHSIMYLVLGIDQVPSAVVGFGIDLYLKFQNGRELEFKSYNSSTSNTLSNEHVG